ncbi:MAG: hypothetical protein QGG24_00715 [Vicinamibacterales bacterium]|jgi:hypothetical protein|nr:hypothetical protein [Vicinamibacterales bacterium]MDP7473059.1 hypothetical protein [Vicinamibacterales bacterium]MDP7670907.1 hypothetical protein [Vicinamibacterales bacterium]HJO39651.1 hypothetical protein [Vicinamibacterales bacterium]|tara:strand:+ start:1842 stop:2045 length:204 start_codon:yes stop_codon:yes gene_type:complete
MPTNPPNTFFETYTRGLTADEFQLLFTRDAREAYRVLSRGLDAEVVDDLPGTGGGFSGFGCSSSRSR